MSDQPPSDPGALFLRTIAMPADANTSGAVFGGWTLSQMDLAGATFAARHSRSRVATVGIEAMRFLHPIQVGDEVSCYCALEHAGETSVSVRIETWTRERDGTNPEKVTHAVFAYVALDENGKPRKAAAAA